MSAYRTYWISLFADADSDAPFSSAHTSEAGTVDELADSGEMGFGSHLMTLRIQVAYGGALAEVVDLSAAVSCRRAEIDAAGRANLSNGHSLHRGI